jgi:dolichol kinase
MNVESEQAIPEMDFKKRSEIHYMRKIWHMAAVSMMALTYTYVPERICEVILIVSWLLFVPLDFFRHRYTALNDVLMHMFKPIMRDTEVHRLAGTSYLITGVGLIVFIFPREVVLLTLLFLAFADPLASFFGIKFGKDKIFGHKSLQGTMAAFFVCSILTFAFLFSHNLLMDRLVIVSLLGGLIGALSELVPVGKLDDNFTLPVLSAIFLYFLFALFGAVA